MTLYRKMRFCLGLALAGLMLAGCAAESISYPRLSSIGKLKKKILSKEEQEDVIRDLSAVQKQQSSTIEQTTKTP